MEELNTVVTFCREKHWHFKQMGTPKGKGKEIPIHARWRLRVPGEGGSQTS
jgi:hypothetical protein